MEGRGILGLVKCLRDEDMHVRHFGALGLVNLTNRPTFHPPAVDVGAIEALAVVADRTDVRRTRRTRRTQSRSRGLYPCVHHGCCLRVSTRVMGSGGCVGLMAAAVGFVVTSAALPVSLPWTCVVFQVLPRRYACLALGNLAITGLYNNHYVSSGAVPTLVTALSSDNEVETRFNAAYAIGKLAHDPGMHEVSSWACCPWR